MLIIDWDNPTFEWKLKEENRVKALFEYKIDLSSPDEELDSITKLLSIICSSPISLVTLLDETQVWVKSTFGFESTICERSLSFCRYTIEQNEVFEVCDTLQDERFKTHCFVVGAPHVRFYAGMPLITPSGYNIGVLCVIDTEPKKLNWEQRIAIHTLAKHIIWNFELKKFNRELKYSNEKANKLAKAKDDFLSNMSHEIRTPLNAIYGFTELLNLTQLNKNQQEMLNIVKSSVEILMAIINDILDFTKIESGKLAIENHAFNLEEAIRNIKELFSHKAAEKNIDLIFNLDKNLPKIIKGDKIRINQILVNLIGNAIKFTNKGFIDLTVKLEQETEDKIKINFSVKDTGIGINKNKLDTIFERFEQASNDITRKYGGTGLGLSISKSLVELQGGELRIESEFGIGSNFYFSLDVEKLSKELIEKALKRERKQRKNKKITEENEKQIFNENIQKILNKEIVEILVCEDTFFNYKLIEKIFEDTIISLDYAENGKIGLEKIENKEYDLILLDLQMPEMDGFELASIIRQEKRSDVLILALTANNSENEKAKCLEIGMNNYLTKPFKRKNFFNIIISIFNNKFGNPIDLFELAIFKSDFNVSLLSNVSANISSSNHSHSLNSSIINCSLINSSLIKQNNYKNNIDNNCNSNSSINNNHNYSESYVNNNFSNRSFQSYNSQYSVMAKDEHSLSHQYKYIYTEKEEEDQNNSCYLFIDQNETVNNDNVFNISKNLHKILQDKDSLNLRLNENEDYDSDKIKNSKLKFKQEEKSEDNIENLSKSIQGDIMKLNFEEYEFDFNNKNSGDRNEAKKNENISFSMKNEFKKLDYSFFDYLSDKDCIRKNNLKPKNKISSKKLDNDETFESKNIFLESHKNITNYSVSNPNQNQKDINYKARINIKNSYKNTLSIENNFNIFIKAEYEKKKKNLDINKNIYKQKDTKKIYYSRKFDSNNISLSNRNIESRNDEIILGGGSCDKKPSFKKLKSKFSIGDIEKKYYKNNHSINSLIKSNFNILDKNSTKTKIKTTSKFVNFNKFNQEEEKLKNNDKYSSKKNNIDIVSDAVIDSKCDIDENYHCENLIFNFDNNNNNDDNYDNYFQVDIIIDEREKNNCLILEPQNFPSNNIEGFKDLKICFEYLNELSAGDYEFQKDLVLIFLNEFPIQLKKLEVSLDLNNYKEIHLLTHSMKSSLNMIGVNFLTSKFKEIETELRMFIVNCKENLMNSEPLILKKNSLNEKILEFANWIKSKKFKDLLSWVEKKLKETYSIE